MSVFKQTARVAFYALVGFVLLACGGHGSTNNTPASVRVVNAAGSPVSLVFNGTNYLNGVPAQSASAYANIANGTYTMSAVSTNGTLSTVNSQTVSFGTGDFYTVLAYQRNGGLQEVIFPDNQATPASGFTALRVLNAGQDPGALDIYVVAVGATLTTGQTPTVSFVGGGALTTSLSVVSGTYQVIVTGFGNQSDVRLQIPQVTFASQGILTLGLTSTSGGALVDGVLIAQGSTPTFFANTSSRVRLVAGIPNANSAVSTVAATIGSSTLSAIQSPTVGSYQLIPSGTQALAITVDGTPIAGLTTIGPAAGADYTLLVFGNSTGPAVSILTDINQATAVSGNSNLRLVNAALATGTLSLTVNFASVATGVTYGSASGYFGVPASSTSTVQVTSPLATFPAYTAANSVDLISEGVYTMFVLGNSTTPIFVLNKDR